MKSNKINMEIFLYLLIIGLAAGFMGGLVGIGGGVIIVPALVMLLGMSQHQAQGTSLMMILFPVGILGVLNYYKQGYIDGAVALENDIERETKYGKRD